MLKEIKKKNEKVFKSFFDTHYADLVFYANGFLFDKDSSEDMVQEVFIYFWEHADDLHIETSLNGYLYAMVRNRCLNYLKSIRITDSIELLTFNNNLITDQSYDAASEDDKKVLHHQILNIIETLPDKMQQVVKLKFLKDYKYSEIAKELNISVNTVKTQLKRAKIKIAETLVLFIILIVIIR